MARDSDGIFDEKWADGGDTGEPVGFDRNVGWPLSYSQPGGEYPTRLLYNLLWKEISALAIELNQNGVGLEYAATIDYVAKAIVRGSDGDYYIATAANGPATSAVNPVGDDLTGVWENYYLNTSAYVATGTANAIVLNAISGINPSALFDGQILTFKATATNTGAATIQAGALGTQAVTMPGGNALVGGEIVSGNIYTVLYIKASTRFELSENPGAFLFDNEYSAENASLVTITTSNVPILTLDMGTVFAGGRFAINAHMLLSKGATAGLCHFRCLKSSGTAVIECLHDKTQFNITDSVSASNQWGTNMSGIFRVVTGGTLILHITCSSFGSNGTVAIGEGQLYAHTMKIG